MRVSEETVNAWADETRECHDKLARALALDLRDLRTAARKVLKEWGSKSKSCAALTRKSYDAAIDDLRICAGEEDRKHGDATLDYNLTMLEMEKKP